MYAKFIVALTMAAVASPALAYPSYPDIYVRDYDDLVAREDLGLSSRAWTGAASTAFRTAQAKIDSHQNQINRLQSGQLHALTQAKSAYGSTDRNAAKLWGRAPASRHSSSQLQLNSVMSNFQKATQLSQIMASRQRQALEKLAMRDSHYVELD